MDKNWVTQIQLEDLKEMLNERYQTQQIGLTTAMAAAEKAVSSALLAAERAVTKAELAADKRFEAVNEFRGQLSDQASTFLPRSEADVRFKSVLEKIELITNRLGDIELRLTSRLDLTRGSAAGVDHARELLGWALGIIGTTLAIYFGLR